MSTPSTQQVSLPVSSSQTNKLFISCVRIGCTTTQIGDAIRFLVHIGLTALHQAVLDDNFTAVRLLLKHGAEVNKLDEDGWTPLHAACAEGHSNIAR